MNNAYMSKMHGVLHKCLSERCDCLCNCQRECIKHSRSSFPHHFEYSLVMCLCHFPLLSCNPKYSVPVSKNWQLFYSYRLSDFHLKEKLGVFVNQFHYGLLWCLYNSHSTNCYLTTNVQLPISSSALVVSGVLAYMGRVQMHGKLYANVYVPCALATQ